MRLRYVIAMVCLATASASVHADWQQASSRHFVVYADDTAEKVQALTTRLERYDKVMRVLHGIGDPAISPNARVTVFVVPSVSSVGKLAKNGEVAGFYVPRASGSVAFVPRRGDDSGPGSLSPEVVLFHEYAHHFMYSSMADAVIPPWLSEGFAEFHATTEFKPNGDVIVGKPPLYRAYGILQGTDLPIETLLNGTPDKLSPEKIQMFYGRGWLLTHYLTIEPARRAQLTAYLGALASGKPAKEAAKDLGEPRALGRGLDSYLRAPLSIFSIPARLLPIDPVTVRPLSAAEAAMMPSLILSKRGVDTRTAHDVLTRAQKAAAPFPGDAAAQNELAEAEFDAGDPTASIAAADYALAADPHSIHAMMYAGMARLAAARRATPADPAAFEKARDWLRRANHADPENPWPMQEYYLSYVMAGQQPTHNAEDGLLYARELAPFDTDLGLMAAYVYLMRAKPDAAIRVLKPVAYDPHGGASSALAQAVLATIETEGAPSAAARLRSAGLNAPAPVKGTPPRP